ncbi:N-acetylmuramoyl-L-alanine amidase [Mediterraneibacter glycyrrhizinilyticus]|uniref:peptidoglycan recognition protein family protein n=1 Tax=Mediterraneibacter glycyrrhizinilyticus TaxID=342942 RepID=UPI00265831DB|nr:peptidoglycan recognition family protein [Mediterraneibacter glycyrrhizinilyticus]MCF2568385.1 N-acetylmuramoyl-L-alanine amidase [Mediterraneibacter glycyrrhizinilyticus]
MNTYRGNRRGTGGRATTAGRRKRNGKKKRFFQGNPYIKWGLLILAVLTLVLAVRSFTSHGSKYVDVDASEPDIDVQLLDVNPYSRPGIESNGITGIVIHYTANPGSTAQDNRDYFNGLQYSQETSASSNFVVGLDGEIIQCVPTWEVAYASNDRNYDTVSIEVCHPDESGKFTDETYRSLVQLTAWLCVKFDLTADDVIRHYDVTGKNCPKYFVENEEAWTAFKENVSLAITSEN